MGAIVRRGSRSDLAALDIFLPAFLVAEKRRRFERALHDNEVLVVDDGKAIAFVWIQPHGFVGHTFVNVIAVHPDRRRHGHASRLLAAAEGYATTDRVFTSTNTSNAAMQAVLAASDWRRCGLVDALDPGDPELIYVKFPQPKTSMVRCRKQL